MEIKDPNVTKVKAKKSPGPKKQKQKKKQKKRPPPKKPSIELGINITQNEQHSFSETVNEL